MRQGGTSGWITYANADRVNVLYAQGDTLWAGTEGGGLVGWDVTQRTFIQWLYPQGALAGNSVTHMTTAPDGSLWVATRGGVSHYRPDGTGRNFTMRNTGQREEAKATVREAREVGVVSIPITISDEAAARAAFNPGYLMFGDDPTIYFYAGWDALQNAVVIKPELRQPVLPGTPVYAFRPGLAADDVRDVAVDGDGRVWISTVHGVNTFFEDQWIAYTTLNSPLPEDDARSLAVDGAGRVWISHLTPGRLTMFDGNWHVMEIQGVIHSLAVDPRGNVWAATSPDCDPTGRCVGGGAWSFDGGQWRLRYTRDDGIADNVVTTIVFGTDGRMWLGHALPEPRGLMISERTASGWTVYETIQDAIQVSFAGIRTTQTPNDLWAVAGDRVWTQHMGAVRGFDGREWIALYTGDTILNSNSVYALATDGLGRVWVGTRPMWDGVRPVNGGINMWDGTQWAHYTQENSGLSSNLVEAVMAGRYGRVWVQTVDKRLQALHGQDWHSYSSIDQLIEEEYSAIVETLDLTAINEPRLWRVDERRRVWVWGTGARFFDGSGWTEYRFEDGVQKLIPEVGYLQGIVRKSDTTIPVEFEDNATAQSRLPSGYLMIGDDPTIYRYESFIPWSPHNRIQISPPAKRDFALGEPIYAVDVGLLSTVVNDLAIDPDGRIWFASSNALSRSTPLYGGISVLDVETQEWMHYTVQSTSRRGELVGRVTTDTDPGEPNASLVPVDLPDAETADARLATGYVMFEGDPTLYRYLGFADGAIRVRPIFSSDPFVGVQQHLSEGTGVYAVEVGLAGDTIARLAFDSDGTLWIVIPGVGIQSFDGSTWALYRFGDAGLPRAGVRGIVTRGREIWVSTNGSGFSVFRDGVWQAYDVFNSGLVDDRVQALTITPGGQIWMGTNSGGISVLTLPGFQLLTRLTTVLVEVGGEAVVPLRIQTTGGFAGTVSFAAEDVPPGVEVTFSPPSLSGDGDVYLTLTVLPFTVPARYSIRVTARSDDGLTASQRIELRVAARLWWAFAPLLGR